MLSADNSYRDLVRSLSQNTEIRILSHCSKEILIKLQMLRVAVRKSIYGSHRQKGDLILLFLIPDCVSLSLIYFSLVFSFRYSLNVSSATSTSFWYLV